VNVGVDIADRKEKAAVFVKIAASSCKEFSVYGLDTHVTVLTVHREMKIQPKGQKSDLLKALKSWLYDHGCQTPSGTVSWI